jgi:hypothetical protein
MKTGRWTNAGVLLLGFVLFGCGDSVPVPPKEDLVSVSGTVKFGGQPTSGILVSFVPNSETKGNGSSATTDDAGKYQMKSLTGKPGVPVGTYSVLFAKKASYVFSEEQPGKEVDQGEDPIPPAWREPTQTGPHNTVTVPAGGATLDFDIPTK